MNFLSNYTLLRNVQDFLGTTLGFETPCLENPAPRVHTGVASIAWDSCTELDLGVDQDDLPFPIQCAIINVPLDYTDSGSPETTKLQLLRVSATNTSSRQTIIINPGGPGESGCDYLALRASRFHAILGGQYNLLSFDPRGTGNTTPFSCAYKAPSSRQSDVTKLYRRRIENVLDEKWEMYRIAAEECSETEVENGRFMSTAFTARDMLQIVNALDEDGLLRYWGSSYGTVLGMTFASMFPRRVDRMLLDATINPHEYMAGTSLDMLLDADKAYEAFLNECITAPTHCALAGLTDNADQLSGMINKMFQDVLMGDNGVQLYREIKNDILYRGLYWPYTWTDLATDLLHFVKGDFSTLVKNADASDVPFEYNKGSAAVFGTRCADSSLRATHAGNLSELTRQQQEISSFGDVNTATSLVCATWSIPTAERYTGNFTAKTAHPILYVNGLYDPAAPAASAYNASAGFEGSRVLLHDSYGHGLSAHPNLCLGRAIRRYFANSNLPPSGFTCPREGGPFEIDIRAWQNNPELLEIF